MSVSHLAIVDRPTSSSLIDSLRRTFASELIRLRRPGFLGIGVALIVIVAGLTTAVTFIGATRGPMQEATTAMLEETGGLVEGIKNSANLLGLVLLSFGAVAVASDYSSGLIRLLVQAEPRRWLLIISKWSALVVLTIGAAVVASLISVVVSPISARATGISTANWTDALFSTIAGTVLNLLFGLLIWVALGFVVAVVTRSTAAAIAGGIGYMLLFENLIGLVNDRVSRWLPGSVGQAVVNGGTDDMQYGAALMMTFAYVLTALLISVVIFRRRDITA